MLPDAPAATAAIADLCDMGLGSEQLGVAAQEGGRVAFEFDDDAELLRDVTRGAAIACPVGAVAGAGLVAVASPWVLAGGPLPTTAAGVLGGLGGRLNG